MMQHVVRGRTGLDRRIPTWASGLLARLARDRPTVVTREDLGAYLAETAPSRDVEVAARELQRLGWIAAVHLRGVWAYLPPGEAEIVDPYIDLRAWRAREPDATFALAGEAAAWHLGYLARAFNGSVAVWVPQDELLPHGLRSRFAVIRLRWAGDLARRLGPSPSLLRHRQLDMASWSAGLPAFGTDALTVQLASRPSSFRVWADLIANLDQLADDADPPRLIELLRGQSSSTWQRAAYLLHSGGQHGKARAVVDSRPPGAMPHVTLGDGEEALFSPEFRVTDRLVAPLQGLVGKA